MLGEARERQAQGPPSSHLLRTPRSHRWCHCPVRSRVFAELIRGTERVGRRDCVEVVCIATTNHEIGGRSCYKKTVGFVDGGDQCCH